MNCILIITTCLVIAYIFSLSLFISITGDNDSTILKSPSEKASVTLIKIYKQKKTIPYFIIKKETTELLIFRKV
jgi:hypothetical protein